MPGLDVLRGIAILSVYLYHALAWAVPYRVPMTPSARAMGTALQAGWLGVNLFFVLSGFLITGILVDTRDRKDYFKTFYVRRALRILPLYVLVLVVFKVAHGATWTYIIVCLLYLANFAPALHVSGPTLSPLWSLAVEEQAYLIWPIVVQRLRLRTLGVICVAGCLIDQFCAQCQYRVRCHWVTRTLRHGWCVTTSCTAR